MPRQPKRATWEIRLAKREWALANPDKVRWANQRWRAANQDRVRRQARERMRRMRTRRRAQVLGAPSRNTGTHHQA